MLQNFETDFTDVSVKVLGIDEVPEEMKAMAGVGAARGAT